LIAAAADFSGDFQNVRDPPPMRHFGGSGEPMVTSALGGVVEPMDSNVHTFIRIVAAVSSSSHRCCSR